MKKKQLKAIYKRYPNHKDRENFKVKVLKNIMGKY